MSQNDPISVLRFYGLDQVLTDQDDPLLWVYAIYRHWPKLDNPDLPLSRLSFGIGMVPEENEKMEKVDASGMVIIERWRFEHIDEKRIRSVRDERYIWESNPEHILEVSRPSATNEIAWVHNGSYPAPLVGNGETRVWIRQKDGIWVETSEVVGGWIS